MRSVTRPIALLGLGAMLTFGCASAELARAREARDDFLECREAHPREPGICEELRVAMNREYDRYEAVAGERARNWREERDLPE